MEQVWFEMRDVRRRKLSSAVWIPLRSCNVIDKNGTYGSPGFKEEFYGVGTLAVPLEKKEAAEELEWSGLGLDHQHAGYIEEGRYIASDIYEHHRNGLIGLHLVLNQRGTSDDRREWHLHQDLVVTLGLKREGDVWVCPDEGYMEIAHLRRGEEGSPIVLEIRAEHLRDYLCARQMALYVTSFRKRDNIVESIDHISWGGNVSEEDNGDRWEGRILEIHEGGHSFGAEMAVFHVGRTDVDPEEDVPAFDFPSDSAVASKSWTKRYEGRKLYRIMGEFWRNEWVDPGPASPRIRGDELPPTAFFTTDAGGKRESRQMLEEEGSRWLWFRPDVITVLACRRGGSLGWFTRDTGSVTCSPGCDVHFGINRLGLINVYAKDISRLSDWQQVIWSGFNVSPDGGVSDELLAAQMKAIPADTQAPEKFLPKGIYLLNRLGKEKLGFPIFKEHDQIPQLLTDSHRFRAVDKASLLSLAKDLARLTADSIDTASIQKMMPPPKGEKWGSLKSLQNLLASQIGTEEAKHLVGPLVGIYKLRLGDAHLQSSEIDEAFALARIDPALPSIFQGYQLLDSCVACIHEIGDVLGKWNSAS